MAMAAEALVVDASVAAKWHLQDEDDVAEALALLTRYAAGELDLFAPEHIRYEVPSTIIAATLVTPPRLIPAAAQQAIDTFLALGIQTVNTNALIRAGFPLVHRYRIAFYDAIYLALAQELGASLITADRKLYHRVGQLPEVIWLGHYPLPAAGE